jgi:uncharacterized damage-inducible protein DinB
MSNAFLSGLFEHKAWCNRQLVAALKAAPASELDRMSWGLVVFTFDHTHRVDEAFRARLSGVAADLPGVIAERMPDLDQLGEAMARTDAWYCDYAARVSEAELAEVVEFDFLSDADHGRMTKAQMLSHVITHGASHRGQIGQMLGSLQVRGAPDMVTSFVSAATVSSGR